MQVARILLVVAMAILGGCSQTDRCSDQTDIYEYPVNDVFVTVSDDQKKTIAGAKVFTDPTHAGGQCVTSENGTCALALPIGPFHIRATSDAFSDSSQDIDLEPRDCQDKLPVAQYISFTLVHK
jgi:hypothetical protein